MTKIDILIINKDALKKAKKQNIKNGRVEDLLKSKSIPCMYDRSGHFYR